MSGTFITCPSLARLLCVQLHYLYPVSSMDVGGSALESGTSTATLDIGMEVMDFRAVEQVRSDVCGRYNKTNKLSKHIMSVSCMSIIM